MNAAGRRRLTAPLMALAAVLALAYLVFLAGLGQGVRWAPPRPPAPLPPAQSTRMPTPVPLDHYAVVWQQPLFSPDRRPTAHAASGSSRLGDLELTGIILTPDVRIALLHDRRGKELRVHQGEKLPDGTTLVELKPRSAVFDASSGRVELQLPTAAAIKAPPTAAEKEASRYGEMPEEDTRHQLLDPESVEDGGEGDTKPDNGPPDTQPGAQPPGSGASGDHPAGNQGRNARSPQAGESPAQRQADRLSLLKAAIQRRRAAEAAAAAKKGDR